MLINGGYLVIAGVIVFVREGRIDRSRNEKALFGFEKTTRLIDTGVYRHIRHPLYASLIYLTWGNLFQKSNPVHNYHIDCVICAFLHYLTI